MRIPRRVLVLLLSGISVLVEYFIFTWLFRLDEDDYRRRAATFLGVLSLNLGCLWIGIWLWQRSVQMDSTAKWRLLLGPFAAWQLCVGVIFL